MSYFVYVVTGKSESGDDYGPYVFDGPPSEEQLRRICESDAGARSRACGAGGIRKYRPLLVGGID